ncbi:hypothetical protein N9A28_07285 [Sulfurimonas sp.]|nr:hypothetical protein [Sulfurimonas sp.]
MRKLLLICIFCLPAFLTAGEQVTVVEVNGFGISRDEAVQNALVEALKQAKGVSIDSKKMFSKNIRQNSVSQNGESSKNLDIASMSQKRVKEATKGIINEYRILDTRKISASEYEVDLAVKILKYKSPGASNKNRRKIAVMPFVIKTNSSTPSSNIFKANSASLDKDILLLDTSGSLNHANTVSEIKRITKGYLKDGKSIIGFNDNAYPVNRLRDLKFGGGTSTSKALKAAVDGDYKYVVLITDGQANDSRKTELQARHLKNNGAKLCSVFISNSGKSIPSSLNKMSDQVFLSSNVSSAFNMCSGKVREKLLGISAAKPSNNISSMITQALTTNITQSRKFAVVDRTYMREMAFEMNLINSNQVPLSEKVKLGQKLGADYLLVGTIRKADIHNEVTHNQSLGTSSSKNIAEFIVDYRIIVVGSSQIKWSDTLKATIDMSNNNGTSAMVMQDAVEKVSANITNSLLGNIYPIRIAQITKDGHIVLNQGGNTVKEGTRLDVMRLGKKIIDPYTKESLGRTESKTAEIEITRVTAKLSYAKVVDGTVSMLKKNDVCRRKSTDTFANNSVEVDNPNWKKTNIKVDDGGGVRLPFD